MQQYNRLIDETSPYLLQHADNPVDWYPWSDAALSKARAENKPILLSIGYSACHWCHVMAHESFEDDETAALMNKLFINIKLDREERPDLDKIYQTAYQLLNRRAGGWPLTIFLNPDDHVPFFAATYVPKQARYGLPAFKDLLQHLSAYFQQNSNELQHQNDTLMQYLQAELTPQAQSEAALSTQALQTARQQLASSFDRHYGGFGQAPKFPHPTNIDRLLRHWQQQQPSQADQQALHMACHSLRKMALGGIYDHLGGGFYRYAVDQKWMIPHFEKMLYDNGPLLTLYSQAWQATDDPLFKKTALETGAWVIREMQAPEGAYYSALDADSEGEEGKFYAWHRDQVKNLLDDDEYAVFAAYFGLKQKPNFDGQWHLYISDEDISATQATLLANARHKLLIAREQRVRPRRDEKILTAWNALAIKGMASAGRCLQRADLLASAQQALDFIREKLWLDGRLFAVYKDGQSRFPAYLDDYAFLIDAILELLQARWRTGELDFAIALADVLLNHFEDKDYGGFFFTADDHERLIQRPKPIHDDALPAGNGIACQALIRLAHLLGRNDYLTAAERVLHWAQPFMEKTPMACNALLLGLEAYCQPEQIIILRSKSATTLAQWQAYCQRMYQPQRMTFAISDEVNDLPGLLAQRINIADTTAYLCHAGQCLAPLTQFSDLQVALNDASL